MNILSIQSWVAYGHVGNASAMFPMQRLGHEVWAVNTVEFSNHTGYGLWKGQVFTGADVKHVVTGISERDVLSTCDGVLSGYMGDVTIGEAILESVAMVKAANPDALYCCDPVMGDIGRGIFVRPEIPAFMQDHAIAAADIITPNHFELEMLSGQSARSDKEISRALDKLHKAGPRIILVTSLQGDNTPDDAIDVIVSDGSGRWRVRTPKLSTSVNGAGDAIAAMFFVHYLRTLDIAEASAKASSAIFGILRHTEEVGARELQLIAAQDEIVNPAITLRAERF